MRDTEAAWRSGFPPDDLRYEWTLTPQTRRNLMTEDNRSGESQDDKKRILIVDDDPEIIDSVRFALQAAGYSVSIARDGNQGLAMAETQTPDLLILDMMMPKRSGFLVLEKIRRGETEPVPIIMITANEGSRHKAYAEMLGVNDYIRKPFAMDRLIDSVNKLIKQEADG